MLGFFKRENCEYLDQRLQVYATVRFLTSHTALAFFYGVFLFLYELRYLRHIVPAIHPVLIAWAGALAVYDILVRRIWEKLPNYIFLLLFGLVSGITAVVTMEAGIAESIKGWIFVVLPLIVFYPVCLMEPEEKRKKTLIIAMLGAAIVIFAASALAIAMYLQRFSQDVSYMGETWTLGIRHYTPGDETSAILLYGIYTDTNHAAAYAIAFSAYSVLLFISCAKGLFQRQWQNALGECFAIINFVVQICYFPLANSRGGWLCLLVAAVLCAFVFGHSRITFSRNWQRVIAGVLVAVSATVMLYGSLIALRSGLSALSTLITYERPSGGDTSVTEILATEAATTETAATEAPTTETASTEAPATETASTEAPAIETAAAEAPTTETAATEPPVVLEDSFEKIDNGSGSGRLIIWKEGLNLFAKRPVFGTGSSNNAYYADKYDVGILLAEGDALHNSYLDLLVDYGLVGFVTLMGFWIACLWAVIREIARRGKILGPYFYLNAFIVLFVAGVSVFLSCTFINTTAMYFLMLIPVGCLMAECAGNRRNK